MWANIGFLCEFSKHEQNFHRGFKIKLKSNGCDRPYVVYLGPPFLLNGAHLIDYVKCTK